MTCLQNQDNGGQFTATAVMAWVTREASGPGFVPLGHPSQSGLFKSGDCHICDECSGCEWYRLAVEAVVTIEHWRQQYNTCRPHSAPFAAIASIPLPNSAKPTSK